MGYENGSVYVRLLPPKGFESEHYDRFPNLSYEKDGNRIPSRLKLRMVGDRIFWITRNGEKAMGDSWEFLQKKNAQGFGVYFVVNPGGHSEADIEGSRVLFWEDDNKSKSEQLATFDEYQETWGGGIAVETNSSIHCYFRHDEFHEPLDFSIHQLRAITHIGSDSSIWDAPRLMRLPGFDHTKMKDGAIARFPVRVVRAWEGDQARWWAIDDTLPQPTEEMIAQATGCHSRSAVEIPLGDDPCDPRNFVRLLPHHLAKNSEWDTAAIPAPGVTSNDGFHVHKGSGRYKVWSGTVSTGEALKAIAAYLNPVDNRITYQGILAWFRGETDDLPYEEEGDRPISRDEWQAKFVDGSDPVAQLEETQENDRLLARILSRFGKGKKQRQRRERVEPIATPTVEVPYMQGCLPDYSPGLNLPSYLLESARQQNEFVLEAIAKGWENIHNQSPPGVGKSHEAGLLEPKDLEFKDEDKEEEDSDGEAEDRENVKPSIYYFCERSRVPSTPTIEENFTELPTRNQGLIPTGEKTPLGNDVLKPVIDPSTPNHGNCKYAHLFQAAGEKNIPGGETEAKENPICAKCTHNVPNKGSDLSKCAEEEGEGYGFRSARRSAMAKDKLRLNPMSAPGKMPKKALTIWEELGGMAKPRVIRAGLDDLNNEAAILEDNDFELKSKLRPLFKSLRNALAGDTPRFGKPSAQFRDETEIAALIESLSEVEKSELSDDLREVLTFDIDQIMNGENEVDIGKTTGDLLAALKEKLKRLYRSREKKSTKLGEIKFKIRLLEKKAIEIWGFIPDKDSLLKGKRGSEDSKLLREYHRLTTQEGLLQLQLDNVKTEIAILSKEVDRVDEDHKATKEAAKQARQASGNEAIRRLEATHAQTFCHIVSILLAPVDAGIGEFVIDKGKIVLTLPNIRIKEIAQGAAANLILDATITDEEVTALLGLTAPLDTSKALF